MKLAGKFISAFVLVALLPVVLMSVLLYLFVNSSGEEAFLKRADFASAIFRFNYEREISELETNAAQLTANSDFLIYALDLPKREPDLTELLESHFSRDEFHFAVVRMFQPPANFKAFEEGIGQYLTEFQPELVNANGNAQSGLLRLSDRHKASIALLTAQPIVFSDQVVGEFIVGKMLPTVLSTYPLELGGIEALAIISENQPVYARSDDSLLNANIGRIASVQTAESTWQATVEEQSYLVKSDELIDLNGHSIASLKYILDLSDLQLQRQRIMRVFVGLSIMAVVLGLVIGYFFQRSFSKPIGEMAAAAKQIAVGGAAERIHYFADDEIGDLVSGINRLSEDLRETEIRLRRSEQVAAWQMFARQTAHEIRNFLMPLATSAAQLERWAQSGQIDSEHATTIARSIQAEILRMKNLLTSFSEFAKMPAPKLIDVPLSRMIDDMKSIFAEEIRSGRLHLETDSTVGRIQCDPDQIRQVILNLVKNSFEATASVVEIKMHKNQRKVVFEISDDGRGIDTSRGIDPFTPLFTTKENGSGLGLAICRRIITDHGGDIQYENKPTGGTTFTFYLPIEES